MGAFPQTRLRRLRRTGALRDLVRETVLRPADLVLPLFVEDGLEGRALRYLNIAGRWEDHDVFAMTEEEWHSRPARR